MASGLDIPSLIGGFVDRLLGFHPYVPGRPPVALVGIGVFIGLLNISQLVVDPEPVLNSLFELAIPAVSALLIVGAALWTRNVERTQEKHASAVIFCVLFMSIAMTTVLVILLTQLPDTVSSFDYPYTVVMTLSIGAVVGVPTGFIFDEVLSNQEQLEQQYEEVLRLNQRMQVFNRVLRHNVRNELGVAQGRIETASETTDSTEIARHLATANTALTRLHNHSERLLLADSLEHSKDERVTLDVVSQATEALELLADRDSVSVETTMPARALVRAHPLLGTALIEAIENAIDHNDPEGLTISVEITKERNWVTVAVADTGEGIPPAEVDVWEADIEQPLEHSSGVGLWFIRWVTDVSDGEVAIDTAEGRGTTMRFRLPRAI